MFLCVVYKGAEQNKTGDTALKYLNIFILVKAKRRIFRYYATFAQILRFSTF